MSICPSENTCTCGEGFEIFDFAGQFGKGKECVPICTQQRSSTGACCFQVGQSGCTGTLVPPPDNVCDGV